MKRIFPLVLATMIVALVGCTKISEMDQSILDATSQQTIQFTTYASAVTSTKGVAVNSNSDFQSSDYSYGSFNVTSLVVDGDFVPTYSTEQGTYNQLISYTADPQPNSTAVEYFGYHTLTYSNSQWESSSKMYWPNYSKVMYFAAYAPATTSFGENITPTFSLTTNEYSEETLTYSFPYTVVDDTDKQIDLMYAVTKENYLAPSDRGNQGAEDSYVTSGVVPIAEEDPVNLHFKHALTQIAFTATKEASIDVYLKKIVVCNVYNSGIFTASEITDDEDADADDNATVGDGEGTAANDKVNADNFGKWTSDFSGDWADLTTPSDDGAARYYYYTTEDSGGHSSMSNYTAPLVEFDTQSPMGTDKNAIMVGDTSTPLTLSDDVLMLKPQKLTPWVPTTSTVLNYVGYTTTKGDLENLVVELDDGEDAVSSDGNSLSYLAIDCEIYHAGVTNVDAKIHDGYIFVPFETKDIAYSTATVDEAVSNADEWLAGYKITYCLNFGGGYIVEEGNHTKIPEPGCIPDTETYTLRPITYTATTDVWVDTDSDVDFD